MARSTKQMLAYLYHLKNLSLVGIKASGKYFKTKRITRKQPTMQGIHRKLETFVFLDLETTGLLNSKGPPPRVTEIGMVAMLRDSFDNDDRKELSRVKYKLVIPLNPIEEITNKVEELTGLSNKGLKQLQPFTTTTKALLNTFLQQLKSPICFVAHNGNRFDYPILLSELEKIGMLDLEGSIYTIDSLHFFKYYFGGRKNPVKSSDKDNVIKTPDPALASADNILLNDGYDSVLSDALDSFTQSFSESQLSHQTELEVQDASACVSNIKDNSPQKSEPPNYCKEMQKFNEKTPESQIIKSDKIHKHFQSADCVGARRRLDFQSTTNTLRNYKLGTIYEHIFETKANDNHTAEGDCITLLQCALKVGNIFVEWADDHAVNLYSHQRN